MLTDARNCLGWPYVSPGSNDQNGIDCSGLLVYLFRRQGEKITHGSNSIWRKHLSEKGSIITAPPPGAVVFKHRTQDTAKYPDGQGDFYHIGLVVSQNPVCIIHASSIQGCVTEQHDLNGWTHWGKLAAVKGAEDMSETTGKMVLTAPSGSTVNVRKVPGGALIERLPLGTAVEVLSASGGWCRVRYAVPREGYIQADFLTPMMEEPAEMEMNG